MTTRQNPTYVCGFVYHVPTTKYDYSASRSAAESYSYQASNHKITKTSPSKPLINQTNDKNLMFTPSIKLFRQSSVANLVDKQPPTSTFSLSNTLNIQQLLKYISSCPVAHQQDEKQLIFFIDNPPYSSVSTKQHQSGIWTKVDLVVLLFHMQP